MSYIPSASEVQAAQSSYRKEQYDLYMAEQRGKISAYILKQIEVAKKQPDKNEFTLTPRIVGCTRQFDDSREMSFDAFAGLAQSILSDKGYAITVQTYFGSSEEYLLVRW